MQIDCSRACGSRSVEIAFHFHLFFGCCVTAAAADTELNIPIDTPRLRGGH